MVPNCQCRILTTVRTAKKGFCGHSWGVTNPSSQPSMRIPILYHTSVARSSSESIVSGFSSRLERPEIPKSLCSWRLLASFFWSAGALHSTRWIWAVCCCLPCISLRWREPFMCTWHSLTVLQTLLEGNQPLCWMPFKYSFQRLIASSHQNQFSNGMLQSSSLSKGTIPRLICLGPSCPKQRLEEGVCFHLVS